MGGYYRRIAEILKEDQGSRRTYKPSEDGFFSRRGGWIKRVFRLSLGWLLLVSALAYVADYGVIRYRVATQRSPFGEAVLQPYYAIHQKNGKIEFQFQDPQTMPCVNALFPRFGMSPCWYARRHPQKQIDI